MLNLIDILIKRKLKKECLNLFTPPPILKDILTKSLPRVKFEDLIFKLGMINIYS
ncbi:LOW QUALITY PROTEIN: hypothetical protein PanWU01x14_331670 [Parasponia andersonii]|uniref:Uncharacterized protein n=1 Tax=Parasponia andersonii TaxID=3476 RepID=A0A2P5AHJ1_PARAD|nr:LOW QUALITY PROTEIN: hypothetical protein PanWU01x14_331670 [Parasponia andersonii]